MDNEDAPISRSAAYRIGRGMLGTVPIVVAGTMAMTMNVTGSLFAADQVQPNLKKPGISPEKAPEADLDLSSPSLGAARDGHAHVDLAKATIETASAPTTYKVVTGDTVSSIAGRYGLSTASVLALNGLSWKSTIYPGQTLSLTAKRVAAAPKPASTAPSASGSSTSASSTYTIVRGDTLSAIASKHHVSTSALLSANGLGLSSIIYPGQKLRIPGASSPASVTTVPSRASTSTTSSSSSTYVIKAGDTLSSIAKAHRTTVDKLLTANHLSWTSTIYAGKKLTIPGTTASATVTTASSGSTTAVASSSLNATQQANARTIIRVGHSLGVSDYGIVVALAAAAQESSLQNLQGGDRDSVGLFQQRPSQGWGTRAQLMDTTYATKLFFGGSRNPNAGKSRGLLDIRGWTNLSVTQAAQAVQYSAYPNAYAKWEKPARSWLASL